MDEQLKPSSYRDYFRNYLSANGLTLQGFYKKHSKVIGINSLRRIFARNRTTGTYTAKQGISPERLANLLHAMNVPMVDQQRLILSKLIDDSPKEADGSQSRLATVLIELLNFLSEALHGGKSVASQRDIDAMGKMIMKCLDCLPEKARHNAFLQLKQNLAMQLQVHAHEVGAKKMIQELDGFHMGKRGTGGTRGIR